MKQNKWLMAVAGMAIQWSIGSIYAYSVWVAPLEVCNGWDVHALKLAFSLAICSLGLTAAFMGPAVQRMGPRKAGLFAAIFFSIGLTGAGCAVAQQSLGWFYFFYGVVSGVGLGFGYITPVSCVVKWFPARPGFASGLVIMSFAIGSMIASQIISPLVAGVGAAQAFYVLAAGYGVMMLGAALYLAMPLDGKVFMTVVPDETALPVSALFKDIRFYGLWCMLFLNTLCGIALIATAAPMAKDVVHISNEAAIAFVGIIGLFNGLGRLFWSSLSDRIGRWATFMAFFVIGTICFSLLAVVTTAWVFETLACIVISCYGGAFATIPAFIKDIYGPQNLGPVLGYVLVAWAAAAFVGPSLITLEVGYSTIFFVFAAIMMGALLMTVGLKKVLRAGSARGR